MGFPMHSEFATAMPSTYNETLFNNSDIQMDDYSHEYTIYSDGGEQNGSLGYNGQSDLDKDCGQFSYDYGNTNSTYIQNNMSDEDYEKYFDCYYSNYSTTDDEYPTILNSHFHFKVLPFEVTVLGHLRPFLVILTTLANLLVIGVFMSKKRRGKATNLLFISIALSDTLTGLVLLPNSFYIYSENRQFLTMTWCRFSMIMRYFMSRVFHTASVWQTVLLGVQRFVCVCHPFISTRISTFFKTLWMIGAIYVFSFVLHIYHAIDDKIWGRQCSWHVEEPCDRTCVYMWFSTMLQHFVPAVALVYLTTRTIYALKKSSRRVSVSSASSALKRQSRDSLISRTAICIVVVFLIPELPFGIYKIVLTSRMHGDFDLHLDTNRQVFAAYEILLIISFHLNFWIYCVMMRDFRERIFKIISFGYYKRLIKDRSDSLSSSNKHSINRTILSRTSSNASNRNRIKIRGTPLPSTASDATSTLVTPPPPGDGLGKYPPFRQTSNMSTNTYTPLLTQTSVDESWTDKPLCLTQMSQESAYHSLETQEDGVNISEIDHVNERQTDYIDDVFL